MGSVTAFPGSIKSHATASPPHARRATYAVADVARRLHLNHHRTLRTVITKLRTLAAHDGMPLPRNPRIYDDVVIRGPRSICSTSLWDAGEFDAWLADRHPPSPALAMVDQRAIRTDLAARAASLAGAA